METVKIDIQKLQLLNDRIAQTIDALNQVRLSLQGIQHTPYGIPATPFMAQPNPYVQYGQYGQPFGTSFGQLPFGQVPYGQVSPFGFGQGVGQGFQGFVPGMSGIQHATAIPFTAQPLTAHPVGVSSSWAVPYASNGLSHTTWDPSWRDATWQRTQAWPWVQTW